MDCFFSESGMFDILITNIPITAIFRLLNRAPAFFFPFCRSRKGWAVDPTSALELSPRISFALHTQLSQPLKSHPHKTSPVQITPSPTLHPVASMEISLKIPLLTDTVLPTCPPLGLSVVLLLDHISGSTLNFFYKPWRPRPSPSESPFSFIACT